MASEYELGWRAGMAQALEIVAGEALEGPSTELDDIGYSWAIEHITEALELYRDHHGV